MFLLYVLILIAMNRYVHLGITNRGETPCEPID